ncbi:hypothetical protein SAMN02746065_10820 [Desulfocicer vacuolatum DSM 3385]|uniref:Uncharacterized protein n=1 Tax=Desulfocicer vacuolatum DSM 3385 TaxID=1121400 RepID=A0A1W2BDV6_9BACT|nr:hypothetical protein [Desulfocicer vacuolatum]SMC71155.1 hypothetical protein SAMN02746065_10820 [Desulfocicer vacuolatum DSM 3385]
MSKEKNKMTSEIKQRKLIYYPIIHSLEDFGQLKEVVQRETIRQSGVASVERKAVVIKQMWRDIEQSLLDMSLSYKKVRLYQDALAVCGKEKEIVTDMMAQGSPNHQLLLKLMEKGATIMGTESPALLLQEYEAIKRQMTPHDNVSESFLSQQLLEQRDRYMAGRIEQTLNSGETGIIFLGILHNLENYLSSDIEIVYPIYRPAGKISSTQI